MTIGNIVSGATAYYTTDGSDPASSSSTRIAYTEAFTVSQSETVKAANFISPTWSSITTATITINTVTPAAPYIYPPGGTFATAQSVSIGNYPTSDACYYTIDGTSPETSGTHILYTYNSSFYVSQSETVEAIYYDPTSGWSSVASAYFTVSGSTLTISPNGGTYTSAQSVTIENVPSGDTGYYTIDGSSPESSSSHISFSGNTTITVSQNETIEAIYYDPTSGWSSVASAYFTISGSTLTISPDGGTYTSAQSVAINNVPSEDTAYYTTDGTNPQTSSTHTIFYGDTTITVSQSETIEAIYYDPTSGWSNMASATFTISGSTLTISPNGGTYTSAQSVTIENVPSGDTGYYTIDGSSPETSGTHIPFSGNTTITVSQNETIEAIYYDPTSGWSSVASAYFTISGSTLTISPNGGTYTSAQSVTIENVPSGDIGYYTIDGSSPESSSTHIPFSGNTTITVSQNETIEAIYYDPTSGWSSVASATFVIASTVQSSSPSTFTDLPTTFWAYGAIEALNAQGLITGYPDGTFKPDQVITRAEFVTILVKSLKLPFVTPATPTFTDVNTSDWFYGAVETAYKNGLASGTGSEFSPNAPISRQEITVMLVQALGKAKDAAAEMNTATSFTDDSSIASWARGFVNIAVQDGLIHGYPGGSFGPTSSATRAEACEMIDSLLKQV